MLDIAAKDLCVVDAAGLRAAITKMLRSSSPLTETHIQVLRKWHNDMLGHNRPMLEGSATYILFHLFPFSTDTTHGRRANAPGEVQPGSGADPASAGASQSDVASRGVKSTGGGRKRGLEDALRLGPDGEVTLGGSGAPVSKITETW